MALKSIRSEGVGSHCGCCNTRWLYFAVSESEHCCHLYEIWMSSIRANARLSGTCLIGITFLPLKSCISGEKELSWLADWSINSRWNIGCPGCTYSLGWREREVGEGRVPLAGDALVVRCFMGLCLQ